MDEFDEDVDPLMGPVAELMEEHSLSSTGNVQPSSVETLDRKINPFDYLSFLNVHSLLKNIINHILDLHWYKKLEQDCVPNSSFPLTNFLILSIIYVGVTLSVSYLFHLIVIIYLFTLVIAYYVVPLCIYYNWFHCLKTIRLLVNAIKNHQQWLINIHGFQLIRPTSSLFENQLYEFRRRIFEELKSHFLYARQIAREHSMYNEQFICYIELDEFGLLINDTSRTDEITNHYDQMSINSLFKLCQLQINECIQLVHLNRPKSFWLFHNYNKILLKSIENLAKSKQNCSIMIDYIDDDEKKPSSKKLISSYFLLRSNCEQLFHTDSLNHQQLKRIVQDLKTVVYLLEGLESKPVVSTSESNNTDEKLISDDHHTVTSYHRFDDQIVESIDEILVCDTGKCNDEKKENMVDLDDYDRNILREQTNCLMKELQVAIEGKRQEWNEREQRLLGNINNDDTEQENNENKSFVHKESFEKAVPTTSTFTMLDELKHTFAMNREKLNNDEDIFGEDDDEESD